MDCVVQGFEQSIDILSFEEQRSTPKSRTFVSKKVETAPDLSQRDYGQLHDEFLESLLQEQAASEPTAFNELAPELQSSSSSSFSSQSLPLSSSSASPKAPKRKRALKLHRRTTVKKSPLRPSKRQIADLSTLQDAQGHDDDESLLSSFTMSRALPKPITYLHDKCELQKDKGKGETPGSDICASGTDQCLEKLRQKMELLMQVAAGDKGKKKKGGANMKRRKARITQDCRTFVETRSVIELRMGFLSMQYGVLLQWDTVKTGKIKLVVLRKMCHEAFYKKELTSRRKPTVQPMIREPPAFVMQDASGGNHVILQRMDGTEVALLDPPFRVQRPLDFGPSYLSISILSLEGLNEKSQHTMHVSFEGTYRHCRLHYSPDLKCFMPRFEETFEWEVPNSALDLQLDFRVFEQRRPRNKRKKLAVHESVALNFLEIQASSRVSHSRQMTIRSRKNPKLSIVIALLHQSDYAHWLQQELEARRKEESKRPYFQRIEVEPAPQEPNYDFTDLCCVW